MTGGGLRRRAERFVQVRRGTVRDTSISFRALGVLTWLLDRPDGWDVRAEAMSNESDSREGREAIRTVLRELAAAGYYRLERRRMRDGTIAMGTAVSEEPVGSWAEQAAFFAGRAVPVVEQADGSFMVRYPDGSLLPDDFPPPQPEIESTGAQEPVPGEDDLTGDGFPGPGKPGPGFPASGFPGPGNTSPIEEEKREIGKGNPLTPASGGTTAAPQPPNPRRSCTRHGVNNCRPCGQNPRALAAAEQAAARAKPQWCGGCHPQTRLRENDDGQAYRCPECHPMRAGAVT